MPTSDVEVVNAALVLLGANKIQSLDDASAEAIAAKAIYTTTLDAALRKHHWNFAQLRSDCLAKLESEPEWGYGNQFALPTDPYCLEVLETNLLSDEAWRIEMHIDGAEQTRVLVTNACAVKILYLARQDPTVWDALFADAFTFELAYRLSYLISRNEGLRQSLKADVDAAWARARSRDGQEGRALKKLLSQSFTIVR